MAEIAKNLGSANLSLDLNADLPPLFSNVGYIAIVSQ